MSYSSYDRNAESEQYSYGWQQHQAPQDDFSSSRSRLDSGSYSNSSGSTTEGGRKKRRSHRPRGCRGGGARRARKALREQARSREALQENVMAQPANNNSAQYPPKYVTGVVGNQRGDGGVSTDQQLMYRAPSPAPSLQPCLSTLSNDSAASYSQSDLFQIFTPATDYVDTQGQARNRVPYGTMTFDSQRGTSGLALSENMQPRNVSSLSSFHPTTMPSGFGMTGSVLPPLPVDNTEEEPVTFEGPNPYSLKSIIRPDITDAPLYEEPHASSSSSILRPDAELYNPSGSIDSQDRALEKQRNMLSDGSLFVTSPRSYLTGRKTTHF